LMQCEGEERVSPWVISPMYDPHCAPQVKAHRKSSDDSVTDAWMICTRSRCKRWHRVWVKKNEVEVQDYGELLCNKLKVRPRWRFSWTIIPLVLLSFSCFAQVRNSRGLLSSLSHDLPSTAFFLKPMVRGTKTVVYRM
jgi:hypothetical protein